MSQADADKWEARYAVKSSADRPAPPELLDALRPWLPSGVGPERRALDLASGLGPSALWLARAGFAVTAIDVSPSALRHLEAGAAAQGLSLRTRHRDLECEGLPAGAWDLIAMFHYKQKSLWPALADTLAPGGLLVLQIATVRNLERHAKPPRAYLVEPDEVLEAAIGLDVLLHRESWVRDRHRAQLIATKP